ncbi:MAG TPA: TRIC cation channel family protein [Anaeromyxobacter sp.]|nr:TRIC cation channel family protein [Anaeromyxobacter sp.]
MPAPSFPLLLALDLAATCVFAVTGALAARRKRFDVIGVAVLALVAGLGGALLRDGLFLQAGPPVVIRDGRYLAAVLAGGVAGVWFTAHLHRLSLLFLLTDAVGLGLYAAVGAQKATEAGLPFLGALLVASVNAVGGSLLRDVLCGEVPLLLRPGELYAIAAIGGGTAFLALSRLADAPDAVAATACVAIAFALRIASVRLGWRTAALEDEPGREDPGEGR